MIYEKRSYKQGKGWKGVLKFRDGSKIWLNEEQLTEFEEWLNKLEGNIRIEERFKLSKELEHKEDVFKII